MNRLIITVVCLLCIIRLSAQTDKEKSRQIFDIQLDADYIGAEGNDDSEQVAYDMAMSELLASVNKVRSGKGKRVIEVIDDLGERVKKICVVRGGTRYRVFLYISAQEAIELTATRRDDDIPPPPKPSKPVIYLSGFGSEEADNNDEYTETVEEEPTVAATDETSSSVADDRFVGAVFIPDDVHRTLLQAGTRSELGRFLKQFKEEGKIRDYPTANSLKSIPSDSYKVVFYSENDEEQAIKIVAILSPANINLQTNQTDNISNYHGYRVMWYK